MHFTIPQFADRREVSRQRIWLLVKQGRIKAERIGNMWLIHERELLKFDKRRNGAGRPRAKGSMK